MVEIKKFKGLTTIGVADIAGNGISAIFWFFLATLIEPESYGEIFYYIGIASMAGAFVIIGAQNTITVYTSKNIKIQSTLYLFSLILTIVASIVIIFLFYKADVILLLLGYVINTLAIGELLGKKLFFKYSIHTLIQKSLTLILGISFYFIFGIDGILYALAISYVTFTIVIIKQFRESKIDFGLFKEKTSFILNNYLIELVNKSNSHLNKFIIVPILGFSVLGNFSLAMQIMGIAMIIPTIVFKFTLPHDSQGEMNKGLKKITIIFSVVIALAGTFVFPLLIPNIFLKYIDVVEPIRIISLCVIPMTLTRILSSKMLGNEKSKQLLISKIASLLVFIILIITLSQEFGIMGLAIGYLVSVIVETLCLIPRSDKKDEKWKTN